MRPPYEYTSSYWYSLRRLKTTSIPFLSLLWYMINTCHHPRHYSYGPSFQYPLFPQKVNCFPICLWGMASEIYVFRFNSANKRQELSLFYFKSVGCKFRGTYKDFGKHSNYWTQIQRCWLSHLIWVRSLECAYLNPW